MTDLKIYKNIIKYKMVNIHFKSYLFIKMYIYRKTFGLHTLHSNNFFQMQFVTHNTRHNLLPQIQIPVNLIYNIKLLKK